MHPDSEAPPRVAVFRYASVSLISFFVLFMPLLVKAQHEGPKPGEAGSAAPATDRKQSLKKVVDASDLARQARKGSEVRIDGAVIRGPLDLSYAVIARQISLTHCDFQDEADFSYSTLKRHLVLDGSTFRKGLRLEGTTVDLNANLKGTIFLAGEAVFKDLQVHGLLNMSGSQFAENVNVKAQRMHVERGADFSNAVFGANVDLSDLEDHSDLFFQKARFHGVFHLGTAKIGGSLFLMDGQFEGPAQFPGMQVAYNVRAERAVFKNQAIFGDSQIGSFLELSGAKFESTNRPANFTRATVARGGFFDKVEFAGGGKFDGAHFNADASFDEAVFEGPASFDRAHFDQSAHFEHCIFKRQVSFNEASFGSLDLSPNGQVHGHDQFGDQVDLQGCTYDRVQVQWQSLLRMSDGKSNLEGLDRQPYFQLQKTYEAAGNDSAAKQVLLEWHRVKRQDIFRANKLAWLGDCVLWLTTNYGTNTFRLLELSALLLLFGTLIFSCPGAVRSRISHSRKETAVIASDLPLRHWDAFAVSLHQFLPLEVPIGSEWTPARDPVTLTFTHRKGSVLLFRMRPSTCATLLKVLGYIVVPLEILILNGLLKPGT
jgi:hypothetical protein